MLWYCYSKLSSSPGTALDFQEWFCHHFPLEESSVQTVGAGVVSQCSADDRRYMNPPFPCQAPMSWVTMGLRGKCSAGAGVSFCTTIKASPSCFAILVPITKEYMHRFWAETSRHRTKLGAIHRGECDIKHNWPFPFLPPFYFKPRPSPTLGAGSIRKWIEVVWDLIFPICSTRLVVQTAPHNVPVACQAGL